MGILDDAIRQHLELKRRQGAADAELARLEDEAFGPPTRPGEPDFPSAEGAGETAVGTDPHAVSEPDQAEVATAPDEVEAPLQADEAAQPAAANASSSQEAGPDLDELDLHLDDEFGELGDLETSEPPVSSLDTVEHPPPVESLDTVEHAVEEAGTEEASEPGDAPGGEAEELEGDDVLEETPEFLRDQPEDDELWFEQGEPKDFDF